MSAELRRIAFFCDSLEPSGVGRVMETLARHLPALGYELFLVVAQHEGANGLWERMSPLVRSGVRLTLREAHNEEAKQKLISHLREWKIDIFHNHIGATWEGHFGTLAAREAGVPCIVATEHLPNVVWRDWELREKRAICAHLDALFAVSNSVRDSLIEVNLVEPERIHTVENGVELPIFSSERESIRREVRNEFNLAPDAPLVLFCGRLIEQKDPHALLRSIALLPRDDVHLLVVGDGILRGICQHWAWEWGIAHRVHFLGERRDVPRLMAAADCFILPSKFEGMPLVILEAMASHVPAVGCDVPGTRDCIEHERTGFLAPVFNPQELSHGLTRALSEEGRVWGEAGYARYCQQFTAQSMASRQHEAYQNAWTNRGSRGKFSEARIKSEHSIKRPKRILWVFSWLVVGGEETELRLLARHLDPHKFQIEVVACFRSHGMTDQTHRQLEDMGIPVDCTPYNLNFDDTCKFLSLRLRDADIIVTSQNVQDVFPALQRMEARGERLPPLVEHGGLVEEARGPKRFTHRYLGVCESIQQEAARHMPGREHHALMLPSMVDMEEFSPSHRARVRQEFGWDDTHFVAGWVGRLDRKKRVEDFLRAAAIVAQKRPQARFVVIGGPDAFMPEYERELHHLSHELGLSEVVRFTGDRADVPCLLSGMDALCWLARGEGMPHIIGEAGAARLPVVATRDNGSLEQIEDGVTGLFVAHEAPEEVAARLMELADNPALCARLGGALREKVERHYSAHVVARQWECLFEEVLVESRSGSRPE